MATFNLKPDKVRYNNSISTLDMTHRDKVDYFDNRKASLSIKKDSLNKYNIDLDKINNKKKLEKKDIKRKADIKNLINDLEEEIYDIENDVSEMKYYSKVEDLLVKYYKIIDINNNIIDNNIIDNNIIDNNIIDNNKKEDNNKKDKLDELDKLNLISKQNRKKKKIPKKRNIKYKNKDDNIVNFFFQGEKKKNTLNNKLEKPDNKKKCNRASLYRTYKLLVYNEQNDNLIHSRIKKCKTCNIEKTLVHAEGIYVCTKCAEVEHVIIDSEKPNYKDPLPEKAGYPYKRINHFNEWLSQFQAKESTEISPDIYNLVIKEIRKQRINDTSKLTLKRMKQILKKLRLHQYYEHIPHITSKITGNKAPEISRETEEIFRKMFKEIQLPFEKNCPKARTNFLSYSYVLHKFCQLLGLDEYKKCFPLLKSREKLRDQDKIWKKMCTQLHWKYYPSI
jgi:hypothetical protein